jgi:murein DD-endopeptidase MepM/ murein hydrolase activator NlpD
MSNDSVLRALEGTLKLRNDDAGLGHFGASRKRRGKQYGHQGIDYENPVGGRVVSPVNGTVTRTSGTLYTDDPSYKYVEVTDDNGGRHRLFYVSADGSVKKGARINKGSLVGTSQDIAAKDSRMKNHLHYEIKNQAGVALDPNTYEAP